ncbi:hypothetical protein VRU48_02780 [Pedobacter sp. KR3-3]|uniref:Uncharacterized protein n=1 Tax=Pedobacter albus TaxID=3113905 RepID=A0ABU7I3T7_9SPHI|nr:hypothetical protein [Pedobacter sp. KR3-3]MEE1944016.1 hypothetical protein [Pedobacter sp. KR3-3]
MKFLFTVFLFFLAGIYAINYLDYRVKNITRREFERRVRLSILLLLFIIFVYYFFK